MEPRTSPTGGVALVGASDNPARYAYLAMRMLEEYRHPVHLISPRLTSVEGRQVFASLNDLRAAHPAVDTVTLYVGPTISARLEGELLALHPRRVIFNPGAENEPLREVLKQHGIDTLNACTLVLLRSGQF